MCIMVRQSTITKQSLPEKHALRIMVMRGGDRCDRLFAGPDLSGYRLRNRRRSGVEANKTHEQADDVRPAHGWRH
jgi:hypothetical protein